MNNSLFNNFILSIKIKGGHLYAESVYFPTNEQSF